MELVALFAPAVGVFVAVFGLVLLFQKLRRRPSTTGVSDATVVVPSSAAHRAVLVRKVGTAIRLYGGVAAGFLLAFLGLGVLVASSTPGTSVAEGLGTFGGLGGAFALLFGGLGWWQVRSLRADIGEGTLLRTTGPVGVSSIRNTQFLDLVDCSFGVSRAVADVAREGDVLEVDHGPRAHTVFEMRGRNGDVVYRDKHYRPESK